MKALNQLVANTDAVSEGLKTSGELIKKLKNFDTHTLIFITIENVSFNITLSLTDDGELRLKPLIGDFDS